MTIPSITLPGHLTVPALGQGTWNMGDDANARASEIATLRAGIEAGMTLIDTAQMYGSGRSEDLVGEAITPMREEVFLVDKVMPSNATRTGTIAACEQSLQTLGTEWIDLYLLHWPGPHPLAETIAAFEELTERGLIRAWGVSNFDPHDIAAMPRAPIVNQVLYNPTRRGIEFDLLPMQRTHNPPIITMAYSPIEQGRLLEDPLLTALARERGVSVAQLLLAWAIRDGDVIAIPKTADAERARENAAAAHITLTSEELAAIDAVFPAPTQAIPLEVL